MRQTYVNSAVFVQTKLYNHSHLFPIYMVGNLACKNELKVEVLKKCDAGCKAV